MSFFKKNIFFFVLLLGFILLFHFTPLGETCSITERYENMADAANMRGQLDSIEYLNSLSNPTLIDSIQLAAYNPDVFSGDKTIYTGTAKNGYNTADYNLNDIATDIINKQPQKIDWERIYVDDSKNNKNIITLIPMPDPTTPLVVHDACSTKSLFNSNFKTDICSLTDNNAINEKCQELSSTNCKIPSCCVLLNGVSCVAGNINGPTFITQKGAETDYYYYKNKCYGTGCTLKQSLGKACESYVPTSTGISKACMVQMFNNYGCPNPQPDFLINDAMVQKYKSTTKKYVDNYIKTAVDLLKQQKDESSIQNCNGNKQIRRMSSNSFANNPSWDSAAQGTSNALNSFKFK